MFSDDLDSRILLNDILTPGAVEDFFGSEYVELMKKLSNTKKDSKPLSEGLLSQILFVPLLKESSELCPICSIRFVSIAGNENSCVCHACGLEGGRDQEYHYYLRIESNQWLLPKAVGNEESDGDILRAIRQNQEEVFELYRRIQNGESVPEAESVLESLQVKAEQLISSLSAGSTTSLKPGTVYFQKKESSDM